MFEARDFIRFWSKVRIVAGGCAEWTGATYSDGYGNFYHAGRNHPAQRIAYLMAGESIPEGAYVLHRCDNRLCVEPSHLFVGSHQDNMDDMAAKGRRVSLPGAANPRARLTPEQVAAIRDDGRSHRAIAKDYGVRKKQIGNIKRGVRWAPEFPDTTERPTGD